ncbi:MAG TPA: hypothetical protein VL996_15310 [Methylocella sp.]|nr:hypothetical protein [Methylocella sp.]
MYAIIGITGQVGSATGSILLAAQRPVRAVVRDAKGFVGLAAVQSDSLYGSVSQGVIFAVFLLAAAMTASLSL